MSELIKTSNSWVKIQAATHRPWQKAIAGLLPRADSREHDPHLLTLFRTGYHLCQVDCPDELMQRVLDDTVEVLQAQRGSIVLAGESAQRLELRASARAERAPHFRIWFSQTLAQRCFDRGESLLCANVGNESEHSAVKQNMASIICVLLRTPRRKLGVLHLDRGPTQEPFTLKDFYLADAIAASVSAALESAQLLAEQRNMFLRTVNALARAVEFRDQYTGDHTQRVTDYALLLAGELHLAKDEMRLLQIGTPLHDIGKIGIADAVLRKPGRLTPEESQQMMTHPDKGAALLQSIPGLQPMIPIVRHHHERWDGKGYPDKLARDSIPRLARIVAVPDAFDAMTSNRPYRAALSPAQAFEELKSQAGRQFDPDCAAAFLRLRPRIERTRQTPARQERASVDAHP